MLLEVDRPKTGHLTEFLRNLWMNRFPSSDYDVANVGVFNHLSISTKAKKKAFSHPGSSDISVLSQFVVSCPGVSLWFLAKMGLTDLQCKATCVS